MPDETQTLTEAAPTAPSGESAEPTGATASPAQPENNTTNGLTEAQPAQAQATPDGKPVWDGKVESLEKVGANEIERGKAMERYLTKRTQELSEAKRKAEQFDKFVTDPSYQHYQQWLTVQQQLAMQNAQANRPPLVTQQEWDEARMDGDPNKFAQLINRVVENRLVGAEQYVNNKLSEITMKQSVLEHTQEIEDFAAANPDFWELYDAGILGPLVREIADTKKGTLADAYNKAKSVADFFNQKATQTAQGRVKEKKGAVTSPPSASQEPAVIWANNKREADQIAFDNALLGKKVNVRVKK